ncbi:MAG: M48 family metallopeptidase [Paracoccaceae bacterium]
MNSTIIRVGGENTEFRSFADYFDGTTAVVRRVDIRIEETGQGPVLVISPPEAEPTTWPLSDIRLVPDQAAQDTIILALSGDAVSRLSVSDNEARWIIGARCSNLHKGSKIENRGRLLGWSIGAIASVAIIIFGLVPLMADQLAEFLPPKGEKALGDATFEQVRSALSSSDLFPVKICESPEGVTALAQMQARVAGQVVLPYPLTVHVLDHDLVNAFALPGGRVVLFRGLIDAAESPDEIAGVLAHEVGHVVNRDPARGALRSAGSIGVLGLLFGDFAGGTVVLFLLNRLIDATYSQEAEALADTFAHQTLGNAGIAPSALANMFERLRQKDGDPDGILAHFMAHPQLGDRIEAARNADILLNQAAVPSLDKDDWRALQNICG